MTMNKNNSTTQKRGPIRAIVIDDSPTARELLVAVLQVTEGVQVVGTGSTGEDAVRLARRMKPDILVMDISMPKLDGLEATRQIMNAQPTPIVLVTGTFMHTDVDLSFRALKAGALTVMAKPGLADVEACDQLVKTIKSMAQVPVVRRWAGSSPIPRPSPAPQKTPEVPSLPKRAPVTPPLEKDKLSRPPRIIGVASSTGGPGALARIFKSLPIDYDIPILVVQHVTRGFATGLAEWLEGETPLHVRLASHGEEPHPGTILIAPDDYHMQVNYKGVIELCKEPPYHGLRPSANYLFHSLARVYGPRAMGIVLTGMGDDGAEGMLALHKVGGLTIAQDQASCVVYGMPKEAVERNAVDAIQTLDEIVLTLQHSIQKPNQVRQKRESL